MMTPTPENTPDPSPVPSAEVTPDAPATQTAQGTLCSLSQSGGFAGIVELLEVTESGAVTLTRERPPAEPMTTQASEEQLSALRAAIESDEWQQLPFEIGSPVPDGFTYEIRCGNKTVTTYDGAERPAVLNEVLEQLGALRQQAVGQ